MPSSDPHERLISDPQSRENASITVRTSRALKSIPLSAYLTAALVIGMGVTLGLVAPVDASIPAPYTRLSCVMGWTYFAAWSISFYPQLYENWRRQSVVGLSLDFVIYSFLGFFCHSVYTIGMLCSATVRAAYRQMHETDNDVAANDAVFAVHAMLVTGVVMYQCCRYPKGDQKVSTLCQSVSVILVVGIAAGAGAIAHLQSAGSAAASVMWLYYMYAMSALKLASTVVKYIPQVIMNHVARSTKGWSIGNVLLDVVGGLLSIGQSVLNSVVRHDWSVLLGNPLRFALGFYSILFDIIFLLQHYVWFPDGACKGDQLDEDDDTAQPGSWTEEHV
jgi:cystinosin